MHHSRAGEVRDLFAFLSAVLVLYHQFGGSLAVDAYLAVAVNVAVSVTGDSDRLRPRRNVRLNTVDEYGRAENRAVERRADRAVGRQPHFRKVILLHALRVGGDRGALYAHVILLYRFRRVRSHLVGGLFAVR